MRDHRRRVEIRLIALREHADHLAELVRDGRTKYYRDARRRDAVSYVVQRVVEFLTDGGGSGEFPGEFKRANPRVPWKAIDRLHGEFVDGFIPGKRLVPDPESPGHQCHQLLERPTPGTLWNWASVTVPWIVCLLEHPHPPKRWYNERHGSLGIAEIIEPHRPQIKTWMNKYHVNRLRVFGSVARGEADDRSDVDLIVDQHRRCRWYPFRIAGELSDIVGRRVSLEREENLYWATKGRVLFEAVVFA